MWTGSMNTKALVHPAGDAIVKASKNYIHYKEFTHTSKKKSTRFTSNLFTSGI